MPEEATTVTFTEYPSAGWIGWCSVHGCDGGSETAKGVMLNYEYDTSSYHFVYYITSDAYSSWDEESGYVYTESVQTWYDSWFPWTVETGQALPSSDTITAILTAIGAYNSDI